MRRQALPPCSRTAPGRTLRAVSRIRVLADDVVNKIAAGEVVERPASVVKELVENSLDARATRVEVEIEDGGRRLVRVTDDGVGMSREEARLSLERHATSKLRDAEGLFHIASFGFRGEALPAIASVSRLTLLTAEAEALEGTRIEVEAGRLVACEPAGAPRGTSIAVRDLFFATPARRKFLKRAETEAHHVEEAVLRLSLSRPDVSFSLRSGSRLLFHSPAGADLRERIAAAVGREVHPHLLPLDHEHGFFAVRGFVASPEWSAPTNRAIFLYVNGRFVRDRQLLHAVGRAYDDLLPEGRFPCAVVYLELPPHQVDVNVHPQKTEVRFADPRAAYEAVYRAIGEALRGSSWIAPAPPEERPSARRYEVPASPQPVLDWHARARAAAQAAAGTRAREAAEALWPRPGDAEAAGASTPAPAGFFGGLRYLGELARTYLLCEGPEGDLVVLDRHAARERLALRTLREAREAGAIEARSFLFPTMVELEVQRARALLALAERLAPLGIEVEPFGGTTFALKSVPAAVVGADYGELLARLAEERDADPDRLLAILACHAARIGEAALDTAEAQALLHALDRTDGGLPCLHGRVVVARWGLADLVRGG